MVFFNSSIYKLHTSCKESKFDEESTLKSKLCFAPNLKPLVFNYSSIDYLVSIGLRLVFLNVFCEILLTYSGLY